MPVNHEMMTQCCACKCKQGLVLAIALALTSAVLECRFVSIEQREFPAAVHPMMSNGAAYSLWHSLHCIYSLGCIQVVLSLLYWCSRTVLSTHLHCALIWNAILAGEAPFATPKSIHTTHCWGYWTLTFQSRCPLGPLDHVVASLQQTSASEPAIKSQHADGDY